MVVQVNGVSLDRGLLREAGLKREDREKLRVLGRQFLDQLAPLGGHWAVRTIPPPALNVPSVIANRAIAAAVAAAHHGGLIRRSG